MGEVRDSRWRGKALVTSAQEAGAAQHRVQSAGDALIKQLAQKQINTRTSLHEQLGVFQQFVGDPGEGSSASVLQDRPGAETLTIDQLRKKTGLSREELEELLSVKPNSTVAKLYRFALSNQIEGGTAPDLISLLPNHPLNHLKTLEEELMINLNKAVDGKNEKEVLSKNKRKKKHRTRRKKMEVKETCEPSILERGEIHQEVKKEQVLKAGHSTEIESTSSVRPIAVPIPEVRRKRPSLWDVKDVGPLCRKKQQIGAKPQKVYCVRDRKIVEVEKKA